jgi:hypothetical protein
LFATSHFEKMGKAKITVSKKYFGPKGESLKKI